MVHETPSRDVLRSLRGEIEKLEKVCVGLEKLAEADPELRAIAERHRAKLVALENRAAKLKIRARLEDLHVYKAAFRKKLKNGTVKTYYRYQAEWRDGNKVITKYLGSCNKISPKQAEEKARRLKQEFLKSL